MAIRTEYPAAWTPPRFREQPAGAFIVRGSGVEDGGPPDLIGRITVLVSPLGQITVGQQVRFTAVRTGGSAPLSYQWSGPSGPIPGATGSSYSFTTTSAADSGTYTVTVTSPDATDGPVNAGATIVVVAPPTTPGLITDTGAGIITDTGARIVVVSS
jgi:hypothetical protein